MSIMNMKSEQERLKTLLTDTVLLLCRNGLTFQTEFSVEALIGITLDKDNVFLLSINEIVGSGQNKDGATCIPGNLESKMLEQRSPEPQKHQRRKRIKAEVEHDEQTETVEATFELQTSDKSIYSADDSIDNHRTDGSHQMATLSDESSSESCRSGRQPMGARSAKKRKRNRIDLQNIDDNEHDEMIEHPLFVKQEVDGNWEESHEQAPPLSYFPEYSEEFAPEEVQVGTGRTAVDRRRSRMAEQERTSTSNFSCGEASTSKVQAGDADQISTEFTEVMRSSECCRYCNRRFTTHHAVVAHERLHKGEYRYYCSICGKGFMGKNHLNGHMVTHTGIREFRCPLCEKEYSYKAHLKEHLELKHFHEYKALNLHIKANLSKLISEGAPT